MSTVIVDYGSGNLRSAEKAFARAADERELGDTIRVSADPDAVRQCDRIVLPGVGAFRDCRDGLKAVPGMWEAVDEEVRVRGKPILGICVGMQLMASRGMEHGATEGFGWIPGDVTRIKPGDPTFKVPHMGWNTLEACKPHALLDGLPLGPDGLHAYFVHSYQLAPADPDDLLAVTDYGGPVTAIVGHGNMAGTQFHPEKSQALGLALIGNFLAWRP